MKHDLSVFHRVWIFLLLALLVGCASCAMGGKKDAETTVRSMSKNCLHGPADQDVEFRDGEPESIHVACMKPGIGI